MYIQLILYQRLSHEVRVDIDYETKLHDQQYLF